METPIDWETLVRRDGPKLYRYFCARFSNNESSDLVQEVLLRIVRKQGTNGYDASRGSFMAYAMGIAHFVAREAIRKTSRRREEFVHDDVEWLSLSEETKTPEEHAFLISIVQQEGQSTQMPERTRQV